MAAKAEVIKHLFPASVPLRDWVVSNDGTGDKITYWKAAIGTQPTQAQIDAVTDQQIADAKVAAVNAAEPDLTTLRDSATQAVIDINTFLAISSPTNAQVLAEVKAIDQRQRAIIKAIARLVAKTL